MQSEGLRLSTTRAHDQSQEIIRKKALAFSSSFCYILYRQLNDGYNSGSIGHGALAQLVARLVRIEEVSGSNPLCSTIRPLEAKKLQAVLTFVIEWNAYSLEK